MNKMILSLALLSSSLVFAENPMDKSTFLDTQICTYCDLTHMNLEKMSYPSIYISDSQMMYFKWDKIEIDECSISFTNALTSKLQNSILKHGIFSLMTWTDSLISNNNFAYSSWDIVNFTNSTLIYNRFHYATLDHANFENAKVLHNNFQGATFRSVNFKNATLDFSNFQNSDIALDELKKAKSLRCIIFPDGTINDKQGQDTCLDETM